MAITYMRELDVDVVTAARQRIINAFSNGCKVYVSVSGGKDSIVMMDIIYKLIQEGRIDPTLMEAIFFDEESMFDDVIEIVMLWRKRFLMVGAKFSWYCVEFRQMNCFHSLEEEETFVCWDRYQRENWCRPMPPFAITSHPMVIPRKDIYQKISDRIFKDGIKLLGVRVEESIQRRMYLAKSIGKNAPTSNGLLYPIYDMKSEDIWLYIKQNNLEYPRVYQEMYACGMPKKRLRVSNFFGLDSCAVLTKLYEFRPDLADKVYRREPNAYLAQMYWDTEMFHRSSRNRKKLEEETEEKKDFKALTLAMLANPQKYTTSPNKIRVFGEYKKLIIRFNGHLTDQAWRMIYESLVAGDPKLRNLRAISTKLLKQGRKDF